MVNEHQKDFVCGCLAAVVTTLGTYPINKLTYRQILEHSKLRRAYTNVSKEGPFLLYRGVLPPLVQKVISLSVMFGVFDFASKSLKSLELNNRLQILLAGFTSGTVKTIIMPFERIQMLLVHSKYQEQYKNTLDAFLKVGKQYGVKEYYRGFALVWIRSASSNSCFFLARGEAEKIFGVRETIYWEGLKNFGIGGIIGGVLSIVFYPFKVMRVVYHRDLGGPVPSLLQVISLVYYYNGRGVPNFFRGVLLNSLRALLSWGLTNMSFEFFKNQL